MLKLETKADLQQLIDERERESLTLEFKAGPAIHPDKKGEIGKDVSAMANAAGGQIIYGIKESNHVAARFETVDSRRFNHEWLEKVIRNNVSPEIEGLTIRMIDIGPEPHDVALVVSVPAAVSNAPHQAKVDQKYYRRHNFSADPMADYEIREAMRRQIQPELQVKFTCRMERYPGAPGRSNRLYIEPMVENLSSEPALYTVLTVLYDQRLSPTSSPPFNTDGRSGTWHPSGMALAGRTAQFAPPHFPIFREQELWPGRLAFEYPDELRSSKIYLGWRVACPGYELMDFITLEVRDYRIVDQYIAS